MLCWWMRLSTVLCVAAALSVAGAVEAQEAKKWPVHKRLLGKDGEKSLDVSGIACTTDRGLPRHCLVIDDDLQAGQFVSVEEGELHAGDAVPLIDNFYDDKKLELDGEGVAYDDGAFYVIGSHGHPRHDDSDCDLAQPSAKNRAKIGAASQVVRVGLKPSIGKTLSMHDVQEITRTAKLRDFIAADQTLQPFLDKCLHRNGVTIEGIAILDGRLYAGFRGPSLPGRGAPILSVPLTSLFGSGPNGARLTVVRVEDGRGVRDLARYKDGLLVLVGPTGDEAGQYDVYWWDGRSERMQHLGDITGQTHAGKDSKPEGMLPLDESGGKLRLLILSDGDKAPEGEPRPVLVDAPR